MKRAYVIPRGVAKFTTVTCSEISRRANVNGRALPPRCGEPAFYSVDGHDYCLDHAGKRALAALQQLDAPERSSGA